MRGTKFSIEKWAEGGNYESNNEGSRLNGIATNIFYTPEGREKTDFNYLKLVF